MTTTPEKSWVRQAALFLISQTVTLFGSSIVQFAISWYITLTTQSGVMIAISTLAGFLPQALISLFAGVWADRYDRKRIIIAADAVIAACTAVLALLFFLGYQELWLLFVISAVRSVGSGVQIPAVSAFLPEIVPQEKLMRVNGINSTIQSVMFLLSPAVAGWLYGGLGITPVFLVDVITAVVGIGVFLRVSAPPRELSQIQPGPLLGDMKSGFRYMTRTPWLWQMMLYYLLVGLMLSPSVILTPLMVARSFGPEPWRLVTHEVVFSVGSILGGVAVSLWGGFRNKTLTLIAASSFFGLVTVLMGFSRDFLFYLITMFPLGLVVPFIHTASTTVMQTRTDPEMIGRVFGVSGIIGSAAMPLSMVWYGPLADRISVELLLIITGVGMVLIGLLALKGRAMREAGEPLPQEVQSNAGDAAGQA